MLVWIFCIAVAFVLGFAIGKLGKVRNESHTPTIINKNGFYSIDKITYGKMITKQWEKERRDKNK
jgi:hypothetical protein